MKFEQFKKSILSIKNILECERKLSTILKVNGIITLGNEQIEVIIELLKYIFGDEYQWIEYWIWELNFGKKYTAESCFNADETIIKLKTIKDLYEFLNKNKVK